jgi:hypothetical protein
MPQPKPSVSESPVLTENPSIPPLDSLLQQINQHQQHLNMFQTLILNQYANSTANCALLPDPLLQGLPDPLLQGLPNSAPGMTNPPMNIPGLGRGVPNLGNPLGNLLLPGLVPLLENLNLKQDGSTPQLPGSTSQLPGGGRGLPNFQNQNPGAD